MAAGDAAQCTPLAHTLFRSAASAPALARTWVVGCLRCDGQPPAKEALAVPSARSEWEDLSWAKLLWDLRQASRAAAEGEAQWAGAGLGAKALSEGGARLRQLRRHLHGARARCVCVCVCVCV